MAAAAAAEPPAPATAPAGARAAAGGGLEEALVAGGGKQLPVVAWEGLEPQGAGPAAAESAAAAGGWLPPAAPPAEDALVHCESFLELAREASQIERLAMDLDRAGDAEQAVSCYRQAAERLSKAAAVCPDENPDRAVLSRHAGQILGRVVYLESLGGAPAVAPIEEHIGSVELTVGAETGDGAASGGQEVGWRRRAASAAAIGGATGLLVLHAPVAAAALAAGAAYATTREDSTGQAARKVGDLGLQAAERARHLAHEQQLPEKVEGVLSKVRAVDEQYRVSSRAQEAASSSWEALRELNRKHELTTKVGQGVSSASAGVASATAVAAGWAGRLMSSRK